MAKKHITILILLLILSMQIYSQTNEPIKRQEVKLNLPYLLAGMLELEYEFHHNSWNSSGVITSFDLDSNIEFDFRLLIFHRLYMGKNDNAGVFLEGNFGLIQVTQSRDWVLFKEKYSALGIGLALGWKFFIPEPSIVIDIFVGMGRLFGNDNPGVYPRLGINLGRRF